MGRMDPAYRAMRVEDTAGFDLNLLRALAVLIEETSVTRAADRLGVSQPAMSRTLGRLRTALGDSLLVRTGRGMRLTARAEAMRQPLLRLMGDVQALILTEPMFEPSTAAIRLTIAVDPCAQASLIPEVMSKLGEDAPGIELRIVPLPVYPAAALEAGDVDLVIAPSTSSDHGDLRRRVLFEEGFSCMLRRGHPALDDNGCLSSFAGIERATLASAGAWGAIVEEALHPGGELRSVRLVLPELAAAPFVVANSDVVVVLPTRLAEKLEQLCDVQLVEPPTSIESFRLAAFWHGKHQNEPAHRWFRRMLVELAGHKDEA